MSVFKHFSMEDKDMNLTFVPPLTCFSNVPPNHTSCNLILTQLPNCNLNHLDSWEELTLYNIYINTYITHESSHIIFSLSLSESLSLFECDDVLMGGEIQRSLIERKREVFFMVYI
jgi:hypothetical protein